MPDLVDDEDDNSFSSSSTQNVLFSVRTNHGTHLVTTAFFEWWFLAEASMEQKQKKE